MAPGSLQSPEGPSAAASQQQGGVASGPASSLPDVTASTTGGGAELDAATASSAASKASPAAVHTGPARKSLKALPAVPPRVTVQQRLQQTRSSMEALQPILVQPAQLPVTFAVSTLTQPGPFFIRSFPETSLDCSTTLPQAGVGNRPAKVPTSTADLGETDLWQSTTWGHGTAQTFGAELLGSFSSALGTPGISLTVLTLSYIDLGDAGMQMLSKGIGRYDQYFVGTAQQANMPFAACWQPATDPCMR